MVNLGSVASVLSPLSIAFLAERTETLILNTESGIHGLSVQESSTGVQLLVGKSGQLVESDSETQSEH